MITLNRCASYENKHSTKFWDGKGHFEEKISKNKQFGKCHIIFDRDQEYVAQYTI